MDELGALTYGRQSLGKDTSIEQQLESGRKRVAGEGWHHHAEYSDRISASRYATKTRDDWAKLLRDLEKPEVNILWLWESSRGDRTLSSWAAMLERCRDHKVLIHVETHARLYDMANARDWRTLAEDGVDNAYESEKVSLRTKRSANERAAEGRPHAAAGYGYVNLHDEKSGKFTERAIEPSEAANIAELFTRIRQGHSLRSVSRDWASRGIRTTPPVPCPDGCTKPHRKTGGQHVTPGTPGVPFSSEYLRCLAMTPAYTSIRVHLTKEQRKTDPYCLDGWTEGTWAPIVDRETFYAVRAILTNPARKTSRPGRAVHLLSVSTAARCDVCDGSLSAGQRHGWTYFCTASGHVRVSESELDAIAVRAIIAYLSNEENYSAFTSRNDAPELAKVRAELAKVRSDQADLADAVTKRGKSATWALAADDEYERQIAKLEARERELSAPDELRGLIEPGADVAQRWNAAPMSARREVARIVLSPGRIGVIKVTRTANTGAKRVPVSERVTWERI